MTDSKELNTQLGTEQVFWNLKDLYTSDSDQKIEEDLQWCLKEAEDINQNFSSKVNDLDTAGILSLVTRLEELDAALSKLATFSFLNFTTQMGNSDAGSLDQKIRERCSNCSAQTVFFELEWNLLEKDKIEQLLTSQLLRPYRYYLESLRRYRPHQLSEAEEKLLLELQPVGRSSWTTLFSKILSTYKFGEKGRTEEEVLTDLYDKERKVRKAAADELTRGLQENQHILTHIFNTLAAEKMISDRVRKHHSWVGSMNLYNKIEDETVDTLVAAVTSRYDLVQRYYKIKKDILAVEQLEDYDRYAPLPSLPSLKINWQDCQNTVLEAFCSFSAEMAGIAEQFFTKSWIHAPILQGKRGGAFAHPCVPEVHPYVMVNYTGNLRDVSTVAHELGHGIHQCLAARQGHFNSDTPLPLAETASVFAELLTFNSQLQLLENKEERRSFICQKLESIFATVFRQTAMNRFEDLMHQGRREKGELSTQQLSDYWLTSQRQMFGDTVNLREEYGIWWSYIPHFLSTPGYVYSYAFGELLVLALYGIYQKEGEPFVEKYIQLLAAGGSCSPYELMEPFNIDLNSKEFWLEGLSVIEHFLEQIEQD